MCSNVSVMLPCSIMADDVRFMFNEHREQNRRVLDFFFSFFFLFLKCNSMGDERSINSVGGSSNGFTCDVQLLKKLSPILRFNHWYYGKQLNSSLICIY